MSKDNLAQESNYIGSINFPLTSSKNYISKHKQMLTDEGFFEKANEKILTAAERTVSVAKLSVLKIKPLEYIFLFDLLKLLVVGLPMVVTVVMQK